MHIEPRISLWNYIYFDPDINWQPNTLETVIEQIRSHGWGLEMWWQMGSERGLYERKHWDRWKALLDGIPHSMHASLELEYLNGDHEKMREQVDCAAYVGADVLVTHTSHYPPRDETRFNFAAFSELIRYGTDKGILVTVENGPFECLTRCADEIGEFPFCLDTGHCYNEESRRTLCDFAKALGTLIKHMHIQDQAGGPGGPADHWAPGTGAIPPEDWACLVETLKKIDYRGAASLEIRPLAPAESFLLGKGFVEEKLLGK